MSNKTPNRASGGFKAVLTNASLYNLLQTENLSRTTGVFSVVSNDKIGYLHLSDGDLVHAEARGLSGEAAAMEILSWGEGQFNSIDRQVESDRSINCPLQLMFLRLAKSGGTSTGTHPKLVVQEFEDEDQVPIAESKVNVLLDSDGNVIQINGKADENFAIKIALIDLYGGLIGRNLESGTPVSIEICGPDSKTVVNRSASGTISGKSHLFAGKNQ